MAERSSVTQITQVGVETTPGTIVPANRLLQALSLSPSPTVDIGTFRPDGQKFTTQTLPNTEYVEADVSGAATYNEIVYPLSSVLGKGTHTTGTGANAGVTTWVFKPNAGQDDNPVTFSVEKGSGVRAHKFGYCLIDQLDFNVSRSAIEISGHAIGQSLQDGITLTPNPVALESVVCTPGQASIYLSDDYTTLGQSGTKLTRAIHANHSIGDRFDPAWFVDAAVASFATHIETAPSLELELLLEADAIGMGLLTKMRNGSTVFIRTELVGPTIQGTTTPHKITVDVAAKWKDTPGFSDEDGIYAIGFTGEMVYNSVLTGALKVTVVNGVADL